MKIVLGKKKLTLNEVYQVAVEGAQVSLSPAARKKMSRSRTYLEKEIKKGETLYGVNTGFGLLSNVKINANQIEELQYNLLRSHAVGTGSPLNESQVRAMLLLRAATLAIGCSGVRVILVEHILRVLNSGVVPLIPEQGSVGASGDLAPLSHLALVLIGEGEAFFKGKRLSGKEALKRAKIKPFVLQAKEGLALINGTQFMTAIGVLALLEAERLAHVADIAGAMSLEALMGSQAAFSKEIHESRPHPGQIESARHLRFLLSNQGLSQIAKSHASCDRVQDPYSLRCMPQVHGPVRDTLLFVRQILEREINSVTDNPLVFYPGQMGSRGAVLSGGNFHGQVVAMAMDFLAIATAELASISEQRIEKLTNPALSELPAFMTQKGGLNSGFMIVQVAAASIVSENKTLCHPASVDSIPTSADKEDHVSMGAWAARKAATVVINSRRVLAMELISACQGLDLRAPLKTTRPLEKIRTQIRKKVPFMATDRSLYQDISWVEQSILDGSILK